jgi:3-oxoacyl-[acyl-carrier protein] reductase
MGKLDGKVALVTGAGRGIGQQIALQLALEGARVVVNDLDDIPAQETVVAIETAGGDAVACVGSVTQRGFAARFVNTALETWGDVHIIVNSAGYLWGSTIQEMSDEQFDAMIDLHLKAPWQILRAASKIIQTKSEEEAAGGQEIIRKVVNISSLAGTRGAPGQTNYASAKAGIVGLTRALAKEWGPYKVTVNAVAFGYIETRLTEATDDRNEIDIEGRKIGMGFPKAIVDVVRKSIPMGRGGTPAEAAGAAVMFCLPETDFVSGQILEVTGGL